MQEVAFLCPFPRGGNLMYFWKKPPSFSIDEKPHPPSCLFSSSCHRSYSWAQVLMRTMNAVFMLSQSVVFCLFTVLSVNASAHNYCLYPLPFQTPLSHTDPPAPHFSLPLHRLWVGTHYGEEVAGVHECRHVVRNEWGRDKTGCGC